MSDFIKKRKEKEKAQSSNVLFTANMIQSPVCSTLTLGQTRFVFAAETCGSDGASLLARGVTTSRCRVELIGNSQTRRLVAYASLAPGAIALVEDPYAAVLNDAHVSTRCDRSFARAATPSSPLLRCSQSKVLRFASRAAQRAASREGYYTREAAALERLKCGASTTLPPPSVRLAARILWRANAEGGGATSTAPAIPPAIELLHHHASPDVAAAAKLSTAAAAVLALYAAGFGSRAGGSAAPTFTGDPSDARTARGAALRVASQLLARLATNVHTVCDAGEVDKAVGIAIYLTAAMCNHSSSPNTVQLFRGRRIVLRAVRPIAEGEELTISYVDLIGSALQRRRAMRRGYAFDPSPRLAALLPAVSGGGGRRRHVWNPIGASFRCRVEVLALPVGWEWEGADARFGGRADALLIGACFDDGVRLLVDIAEEKTPSENATSTEESAHDGGASSAASTDVEDIVVRLWLPPSRASAASFASAATANGMRFAQTRAQLLTALRFLKQLHRCRECAATAAFATDALRCATAAESMLRNDVGGGGVAVRLGAEHVLRLEVDLAFFDAVCAVSPNLDAAEGGEDERGMWRLALRAGLRVAAAYDRVLPNGMWPQRALHWYRVAKVARLCDEPRDALAAAEGALATFELTHGALLKVGGGCSSSDAAAAHVLRELRELKREALVAAQMAHVKGGAN